MIATDHEEVSDVLRDTYRRFKVPRHPACTPSRQRKPPRAIFTPPDQGQTKRG